MRGADLEPGKGIERSLKNQVRQSDRRLQRVAYHILQHPVALKPAAGAEFGCALRVDENHHAELLGFGPKWVEFGIRQLLAVDAAADQRAAQSEVFDGIFELRGGELRVLQGNRRQAGESVRLRCANFGELLVLQLDDLVGEIGFGLGPKDRIEAERLDVDALLIHRLDALWRDDEP